MKRVLSLVLAISMVMSMFTFSFAGTSLKDVDGTDYESAVEALVELGIVNGYEDGTYRPEQNVSRAEMAKLLVVAAGLEPAAKLAEGATKFADVNGGWASGYVNVAAEYGYVMGDPDGNFRPDDTVSYAEAATMALRVLGYKSVVEAKGTWPTNYIAKAEDLELLEDITYTSYSDGAARGNVAILIWNMLRTRMWDVVGESEGDGLQYEADRAMLNVKFPDYSYAIVNFDSFAIEAGKDTAEVKVTLDNAWGLDTASEAGVATYEYVGNDFYTFVEGTEVEVLVNEEDELLLTMVATGKDRLVEGSKIALDEDYDALDAAAYTYAYGIVVRKEIAKNTKLAVSSEFIYEKTVKEDKYVKLNKVRMDYEDYDYEIILKDGERATLDDIEVGDVLSTVAVSNGETFYVVSRDTAEGKLTKYVVKNFEDAKELTYDLLTVGGEDYVMDPKATYVEDPENEDEKQTKSFAKEANDDMRGEEVTLIRDFMGRVVRVEFDGSIDEEATELKFFVVTEEVEKEGVGSYVIGLENKDESDTYKFAKTYSKGKEIYTSDELLTGKLVLVKFNEDDEITYLRTVAFATVDGKHSVNTNITEKELTYEDAVLAEDKTTVLEPAKYYIMTTAAKVSYDDKNEYLEGFEDEDSNPYVINVDENVIVISMVADDKNTDETDDDELSATFETGLAALEDINDEKVLVITDSDDKFGFAKYVVTFNNDTDREDNLVGIVEEAENNVVGEFTLTVDGTTYTFKAADNKNWAANIEALEDDVVLFAVETDKDGEEFAIIDGVLTLADLANYSTLLRVTDATEKAIAFSDGTSETFKDTFHDRADDVLFVKVTVTDSNPKTGREVEFISTEAPVEGLDVDAKFFAEDDAVIVKGDVVWVIEGLDWPSDDAGLKADSATTATELEDAIAAGGSVTVAADMDLATAATVTKDTTVDLNGKDLTVTEDTAGDGVFHVTAGTLTIDGEGTVDGVGDNKWNIAVFADGGDVIINDGTFTNEGAVDTETDPNHFDLIYAKNGSTVTINGGTFKCQTPQWTLNVHDGSATRNDGKSVITVKGGTFYKFDPSNAEVGEGEIVVPAGYKVVAEGDWFTVVAE